MGGQQQSKPPTGALSTPQPIGILQSSALMPGIQLPACDCIHAHPPLPISTQAGNHTHRAACMHTPTPTCAPCPTHKHAKSLVS